MNAKKLLFFVFFFVLLVPGGLVLAQGAPPSVPIKIKVQALGDVMFEGDFFVQPCEQRPESEIFSVNAWCAAVQLAEQNGWEISGTWGDFGVFLDSFNGYTSDFENNRWWLWYSEWEPGATSLNEHVLSEGENLMLLYGASPLKITADNLSPNINSTSTIDAFYFDMVSWGWRAASSTIFAVNGQEYEVMEGRYEFFTSTTSPYKISAKKDGFAQSQEILISPQLPKTKTNLQVETIDGQIFNQEVEFSACEKNISAGIYDFYAFCALSQSGLDAQWSFWGDDAFLESLGGYQNNQDENGIYWLWFDNLDYGQTSLNKHVLKEGDNLLLTYGKNPLRILAATTTPAVNESLPIQAEEFGFDASWIPSWSISASSTFSVNGEEFFSPDGNFELLIATTSPYYIFAKKDTYINSLTTVIFGQQVAVVEEPASEGDNSSDSSQPSSGGGGGGGGSVSLPMIDIEKAARFLAQNQLPDGSFGADLYTDWAAVGFGAISSQPEVKDLLKNFLLSDQFESNNLTDYERRAFALMALGVNPYNGTGFNYIQKILEAFDGQQFGDPEYFNDDIFAVIALLNAGWQKDSQMIVGSTEFILSFQDTTGSFLGVDLTSAAIQAFSFFPEDANIAQAKAKSIEWLRGQQLPDGGFGNSFSTSWAAQAIKAGGENISDWTKNGRNPLNYLGSIQAPDGGLESEVTENSSRIWATAYSLAAGAQKTWDEILVNFSVPTSSNSTGNTSGNAGIFAEPPPSLEIATSTSASTATSTSANNVNEISEDKNLGGESDAQIQTSPIVEQTPGAVAASQAPAPKKAEGLVLGANSQKKSPVSASKDIPDGGDLKPSALSVLGAESTGQKDQMSLENSGRPLEAAAAGLGAKTAWQISGLIVLALGAYLLAKMLFFKK